MTETAKRRSNLPFWALLAITGLPFIAAWIVFFNPSLLGDLSLANRGTLMTPTRPIPHLNLNTLDGRGFNTGALKDQWTMIAVSGAQCGRECEINLYHMRQIRLATGENRTRVQRILVLRDDADRGLAERLVPFEGTLVVTGPADARDALLAMLDDNGGSGNDAGDHAELADRIFLVDPLGNLMMAYPPVPPADDVLKDLERLLKVVQL